ncbi:hypothetical protein GV791_08355 [Nocardia cyriacigeorgica]|uniref:Uncharacterized protein n=1 Tax=Nocardia cyriacigeorgica TaxID=135487 RepID=A0A6P1CJ52_9NOCA|nr:hypothetical protein [Nocardia cyriacigeorgica]NEW32570.1 hypothetical protein [Nocardia cyriacigeorgica]
MKCTRPLHQAWHMPATCPSCSWPTPTAVSTHGTVRYLRCVCGQWIVCAEGAVVAAPGSGGFAGVGGARPDTPARADR